MLRGPTLSMAHGGDFLAMRGPCVRVGDVRRSSRSRYGGVTSVSEILLEALGFFGGDGHDGAVFRAFKVGGFHGGVFVVEAAEVFEGFEVGGFGEAHVVGFCAEDVVHEDVGIGVVAAARVGASQATFSGSTLAGSKT